jgi:hypothetical protein
MTFLCCWGLFQLRERPRAVRKSQGGLQKSSEVLPLHGSIRVELVDQQVAGDGVVVEEEGEAGEAEDSQATRLPWRVACLQ